MAYLYLNSRGQPWYEHSYSAGNDYDQSPYKYYLRRVLGWREKESKASFAFGHALEEAIQYHHDHDGNGAVDYFVRRWTEHKGQELKYTKTEKDWETCLKMGSDMVRLYIAMQPKLPIPLGAKSVFQRKYKKEVFPGDENYGGIEDTGKFDIVCYVEPNHPLLAKTYDGDPKADYRPIIVDIKTSATNFAEQTGMAAFDNQLRRYSWISNIRDVALLWFKKAGLGFKKGYSVTFLEPVGQFKPGDEGVVAQVEGEELWLVSNDFLVAEMERVQGKGDGAEDRRDKWLKKYGVKATTSQVTKQRLQFNAGYVSKQSADEAGQIAARQIISIVNSWKYEQWPNTFGIRYPKDDRNDAYFRAFVAGDEKFKENNFVRSAEQKFDDLFQEDDEDEN